VYPILGTVASNLETLANVATGADLAVINRVADEWTEVRQVIGNGQQAILDAFAADVARVTPTVQREQLQAAFQSTRTAVDRLVSSMTDEMDALRSKLEASGVPRKPTTSDVAGQTAVLSDRKADIKMTMDATPTNQLADAMLEELRTAVAQHDELMVWLLGASDWPQRYLTTRDSFEAMQYGTEVADAVALGDDEEGAYARRLLGLIDSRDGWVGALLGIHAAVDIAFDDLGGGRVDSVEVTAVAG
jgi:hypothetical protein